MKKITKAQMRWDEKIAGWNFGYYSLGEDCSSMESNFYWMEGFHMGKKYKILDETRSEDVRMRSACLYRNELRNWLGLIYE